MSKVVPISRDDELLEAASRWVLRVDEGPLSAGEEAALAAWLDEHRRHRELLVEAAAVWEKTDALARLAELFPHDSATDRMPHRPWQRRAQVAGAAAGLVALVLVGLLLLNPDGDGAPSTMSVAYETAVGERKTVLLPDASEMVLNTDSQVAVTFTPSARVLRLARGEVLVRVAADPARPLSVIAGDRIIQAIGTEFVVEITEDRQVELLVTEGRVVIGIRPPVVPSAPGRGSDGLGAVVPPPVLAPREDNIVSTGESVILAATGPVKKTLLSDDIEVELSWREGRLIFRSEPLEKALREVERYTTVEFVILDESLRTRTLSGRFRAGDVEALLLSLRVNFGITHEFDGARRVLLSSR